jgi:hypothetical protein
MDLEDDDGAIATERRQVLAVREHFCNAPWAAVAKGRQAGDRLSKAVARDEEIEVAHEAPARVGVKAVDQTDGAFQQDGLDFDLIEAGGSLPELAS